LLGIGRIGIAVIQRALPFGFRIIAHDPYVHPSAYTDLGIESVSLNELFGESDILTLHLPLTHETRHIINSAALGRMKPGTSVVNASRGGLIDEVALAESLGSGHLSGAALDVFEHEPLDLAHPLLSAPGAILTSHCAWYAEEAYGRLHQLAAEEVGRLLTGRPGRNVVNAGQPISPKDQ